MSMPWISSDSLEMSPRPPFLSAPDYVFYLRRQIDKERGDNHGDHDAKESAFNGSSSLGLAIELPKLSELLRKLAEDLRGACSSFIDDFDNEPNNGISLLLDILRLSLNRQQCPGMVTESKESSSKNKLLRSRDRQHQLKRAMTDEYDCLLCLKHASTRSPRVLQKILSHRNGLSTLASCIVSNLTKSRLIALQLLTSACNVEPEGAVKVLEAMSTMRIVFGESVRFKLLVAILNSSGPLLEFEGHALAFLNNLLSKSSNAAERVRLQCELEEAGLDIALLEKKLKERNHPPDDAVWPEMKQWKDTYVDVVEVFKNKRHMVREIAKLNEEIDLLQRSLTKLQDDKLSLMTIERELKEKCDDYEQEVAALRLRFSGAHVDATRRPTGQIKSARPGSDNSDPVSGTGDSGRWSDSDGCEPPSGSQSDLTKARAKQKETAPSPDSYSDDQNVRNEDILIYIPAIRPPASFPNYKDPEAADKATSESQSKSKVSVYKGKGGVQKNIPESRWKLRQRNSSGSDKKPTVVEVYPKKSQSVIGLNNGNESPMGADREDTEFTLDWNYPSIGSETKTSVKTRSERINMINHQQISTGKLSNSMSHLSDALPGQKDFDFERKEDNSQFLLKRRDSNVASSQEKAKLKSRLSHSHSVAEISYLTNGTNGNSKYNGSINSSGNSGGNGGGNGGSNSGSNSGGNSLKEQPLEQEQPPRPQASKPKNFASSLQSYFFSGTVQRSKLDRNEAGKSFPLPSLYKKNFIAKGHSNCGLYSGQVLENGTHLGTGGPASPLSDNMNKLVHREIALAATDIGAWL